MTVPPTSPATGRVADPAPDSADGELFDALAALGRTVSGGGGEAERLYARRGVLVVRVGDVVVRSHRDDAPEAGHAELVARLRVAADVDALLSPLGPARRVAGRTVTVWPFGHPVDAGADPPWEEGARLLARLHRGPVPDGAPAWRGPVPLTRAVRRLPEGDGDPAVAEVRRAFASLPARIRIPGGPPGAHRALVHGDWHLGQLVAVPDAGWRLIDVDDLGAGDPAWDLARPAALYCAGVLPAEEWQRFLTAYAAAGGPAVGSAADPWPELDLPARALAVQVAATRVARARADGRPLDGYETALVDTCSRIARRR